MQNFKAHILHDTRLLHVHFNRIAAPGTKYFVEMTLDDIIIARFEMQKDQSDKWKVMMPVHEWVLSLEPQLAQVIKRNYFATAV